MSETDELTLGTGESLEGHLQRIQDQEATGGFGFDMGSDFCRLARVRVRRFRCIVVDTMVEGEE